MVFEYIQSHTSIQQAPSGGMEKPLSYSPLNCHNDQTNATFSSSVIGALSHHHRIGTSSLSSSHSLPVLSHNLLPTSVVDIASRRSMSDSCVVQVKESTVTYNEKNTIFMFINRSGASTIKKIIHVIMDRCRLISLSEVGAVVQPPVEEIFILSQWAIDAYYKIIIRTNDGVNAIVQAMRCFPGDRNIQECCCLALSNMCFMGNNNYGYGSMVASSNSNSNANYQSRRNSSPTRSSATPSGPSALSSSIDQPSSSCPATLKAVQETDGVHYIVLAMKMYPTSVAVQSAACDALRNMSDLVFSYCSSSSSAGANTCNSSSSATDTTMYQKQDNSITESPTSTADIKKMVAVSLPTSHPTRDELIPVLSHAKNMYLHPIHKTIAESLLSVILSSQTIHANTL